MNYSKYLLYALSAGLLALGIKFFIFPPNDPNAVLVEGDVVFAGSYYDSENIPEIEKPIEQFNRFHLERISQQGKVQVYCVKFFVKEQNKFYYDCYEAMPDHHPVTGEKVTILYGKYDTKREHWVEEYLPPHYKNPYIQRRQQAGLFGGSLFTAFGVMGFVLSMAYFRRKERNQSTKGLLKKKRPSKKRSQQFNKG